MFNEIADPDEIELKGITCIMSCMQDSKIKFLFINDISKYINCESFMSFHPQEFEIYQIIDQRLKRRKEANGTFKKSIL